MPTKATNPWVTRPPPRVTWMITSHSLRTQMIRKSSAFSHGVDPIHDAAHCSRLHCESIGLRLAVRQKVQNSCCNLALLIVSPEYAILTKRSPPTLRNCTSGMHSMHPASPATQPANTLPRPPTLPLPGHLSLCFNTSAESQRLWTNMYGPYSGRLCGGGGTWIHNPPYHG